MATLTVNGASTGQVMNGIGSNVNSWSWKNGEITPALDLIVGTLHHSIFRVVHDRMEWAGTGSTRPATTLTNLAALNTATLVSVYESADMADLWNTIAYLNGKGVTGDQIMLNFMGWTAPWMGGSGEYGTSSSITNNTQTNQDIATMLASCAYYGHHRRDISGSNANLSFGILDPFNEPDWNGLEGPLVGGAQMNTIFTNILSLWSGWGDSTTKLMGPDSTGDLGVYANAFSSAVRARMGHYCFHTYPVAINNWPASVGGLYGDWITETSIWIPGADNNQPPSDPEWTVGVGIGDLFMQALNYAYSAILVWEAFDTFWYHHDSFSAWGHVGCTQAGGGCTVNDGAGTRTYAARARGYPLSALAKAARPGTTYVDCSTNLSGAVAFYNSSTGALTIAGRNSGSAAALTGTLSNVGTQTTLELYQTDATHALAKTGNVAVSGGGFTTSLWADSFFYLGTQMPNPPLGILELMGA